MCNICGDGSARTDTHSRTPRHKKLLFKRMRVKMEGGFKEYFNKPQIF